MYEGIGAKSSCPRMQVKFFDVVVIPMYKQLAHAFPATTRLLDAAERNRAAWVANKGMLPKLLPADSFRSVLQPLAEEANG